MTTIRASPETYGLDRSGAMRLDGRFDRYGCDPPHPSYVTMVASTTRLNRLLSDELRASPEVEAVALNESLRAGTSPSATIAATGPNRYCTR